MAGAQHPVVGQGPPSPSRRQVSRGPSCGQRAGPSSKGRRRNYESPSQKLVACASFWSPPKQGAPMSARRRVPDWLLERLARGELPATEADALQAELAAAGEQ